MDVCDLGGEQFPTGSLHWVPIEECIPGQGLQLLFVQKESSRVEQASLVSCVVQPEPLHCWVVGRVQSAQQQIVSSNPVVVEGIRPGSSVRSATVCFTSR